MENTLMVSVEMITYKHEAFIAQAIQGVLMQETTFDYDLIIADDCSPDGTELIVRNIIANHPKGHLIKYFRHEKNLGMNANGLFALNQGKGKYISLCEGDDYWTDPLKLQKQVDFLENNVDYSMCCGGYESYNSITKEINKSVIGKTDKNTNNGFTFTLDTIRSIWITKTFTSMYRSDSFDISILNQYASCRDIHLFYHILVSKKGFYFNSNFGVYTIHPGGVNSMQQGLVNVNAAYNSYKELHHFNKDDFSREMALKATITKLNYSLYEDKNINFSEKSHLLKESLVLLRKPKEFRWFMNSLFPNHIKEKLKK